MVAVPNSITTMKNGSLSVNIHIGYADADRAFASLHPLLHREAAVDFYKMEDE